MTQSDKKESYVKKKKSNEEWIMWKKTQMNFTKTQHVKRVTSANESCVKKNAFGVNHWCAK